MAIFNTQLGNATIAAVKVCWGQASPNASPTRIWDFFDDSRLSVVDTSNPVAP